MRLTILIAVCALVACGPTTEGVADGTESGGGGEAAANDPGISMAEFQALQTGMSQEEVAGIVGSPGELLSENEMAGTRTVMVQWEGEGGYGANANAMFQDGKLIQKSQFGLE